MTVCTARNSQFIFIFDHGCRITVAYKMVPSLYTCLFPIFKLFILQNFIKNEGMSKRRKASADRIKKNSLKILPATPP